jgi:tetratricopeptide (TPR) repeat protein
MGLPTVTRKAFSRVLGVAALAAAVWALPLAISPFGLDGSQVLAQEQQQRGQEKTRRTPALRNEVYEKLSAAQQAAEGNNFSEAKSALDALVREYSGKKQLNSYELANVHNFYAFIYYSQENYQEAIRSYEKVLAQADIPEAMEIGTRYSLAQLYFVIEDYAKAAQALEAWFRVAPNPAPDAYILLAQANYQLKQYDKALQNVQKGMAEAERRNQEPKENWWLLMRVLYYEKGDIKKTTEILEILAKKWPKKDYFVQLSGMYGELKQDKKQLGAMETAYLSGWVAGERELVNMAYLYLGGDAPYKAARVLEKGLKAKQIEPTAKNLELYGIALRQARENKRAVVELERAAGLANDGEMWSRLANIYLDLDNNGKAAEAARKSINLGGGRRPDNTRIVLGMALYNLGKYKEAKNAFAEARKDKRSEKIASQWLKFLDTEIEREAELAKEA